MSVTEPEPKGRDNKKIRKRDISLQIQKCLNDAEAALHAPASTQSLIESRMTILTRLLTREQYKDDLAALKEELKGVREELVAAKAEIERLKPLAVPFVDSRLADMLRSAEVSPVPAPMVVPAPVVVPAPAPVVPVVAPVPLTPQRKPEPMPEVTMSQAERDAANAKAIAAAKSQVGTAIRDITVEVQRQIAAQQAIRQSNENVGKVVHHE